MQFARNGSRRSQTARCQLRQIDAIKWCVGPNEGKCLDLKVRALYVDSRVKEFTLGASHDITERLFVVRRAFRVNDNLPGESISAPRWVWQRGGWLLVDRMTGHVSAISSA